MARRTKSSTAEDFVVWVAKMPWWVGVALALMSYLLLHWLTETTFATQPGKSSATAIQALLKAVAAIGQFVVPILCLGGAGISVWQRKVRQNLITDLVQSRASDALDGMSWREFEMLVGEGFRLQGYQVVETGGGGADGGVDLVLSKPGKSGGEKFLVQCKQWRAYKVGVDVVRELYGVMAARGATGGFVVTSGRFTEEAVSFASGRNVTLVDGAKLRGLIQEARARGGSADARAAVQPSEPTSAAPVQSPTCPLCSRPMARRTAKRGANAGNEFWGCSGYPACRGTRPIG